MLYKLDHILNDIETSIQDKKPFSIARLGDGDIKLLFSVQNGGVNSWKFRQQGIPFNQANWIYNLYRISCNNANYVSSFDMYFDGSIWQRPMSKGMRKKISNWKEIYAKAGITNMNYCSPEVGFLFFLDEPKNLLTIMKNKKICLITCFRSVEKKLIDQGFNVSSIIVPGRNQNHFRMYKSTIKAIRKQATKYDVFLVGAGSLGRGYSNCVKLHGGVAVDIGQVFDAWAGYPLAKRVKRFLVRTKSLTFRLTERTKQFRIFF